MPMTWQRGAGWFRERCVGCDLLGGIWPCTWVRQPCRRHLLQLSEMESPGGSAARELQQRMREHPRGSWVQGGPAAIGSGAFPCGAKQSRRNVAASSCAFGENNAIPGAGGRGGSSCSPPPPPPPCLVGDGPETEGWKVPRGAGDTPGCDEQLMIPDSPWSTSGDQPLPLTPSPTGAPGACRNSSFSLAPVPGAAPQRHG